MTCYVCGKEASRRCPRCAKPYCEEHGDEMCAACQDPASAIPSSTVFRGSLLALLVASILALWLLIQPPGLPGDESGGGTVLPLPTSTPSPRATTPAPASATATSSATATQTATASVTATVTPTATGTATPPAETATASPAPQVTPSPTPTATPPPSPFTEYVVQAGDSLSSIAQKFGTTADELARINGITDPNTLDIGQKLQVPTAPAPAP
ncbi:MAG: LysM peptidoglycan-binding domain-containing protein [Dehalococcoidia bacterium]|nr:LysM peptidoglycan-binding domain-containing protein [Dehalococcoidia bacterium]